MSSIVRFLSELVVLCFASLAVGQLIGLSGSGFFGECAAHDPHPLREIVVTSVYSLTSDPVDCGDRCETFMLVDVEPEDCLETIESQSGVL